MSSWHELPRAAFDVETTGRDPQHARIVSASIVLVNGRGEVRQRHEWLADPGIEIPPEVTAIHGISTERARAEGLPAAQVAAEVAAVLAGVFEAGIPVLAFNAPYDFTVLAAEARRYSVAGLIARPVIDPFILNKQVDKYRRGKRTLIALCEEYKVVLDEAHTSAADALATIGLADAMLRKYPQLKGEAAALHEMQVVWAAAQAADFQAFLRRTKPDAVIDGVWPVAALLPQPDAAAPSEA